MPDRLRRLSRRHSRILAPAATAQAAGSPSRVRVNCGIGSRCICLDCICLHHYPRPGMTEGTSTSRRAPVLEGPAARAALVAAVQAAARAASSWCRRRQNRSACTARRAGGPRAGRGRGSTPWRSSRYLAMGGGAIQSPLSIFRIWRTVIRYLIISNRLYYTKRPV